MGEGYLSCRSNRWTLRLYVSGTHRPVLTLPTARTVEEAEARKTIVVRCFDRLMMLGKRDLALEMAKRAATALNASELSAIEAAIEVIASGRTSPIREIPAGLTFQAFGEMWTTGALAERWPTRIRRKKTWKNDEYLLKRYIYPRIGSVPVTEVTLDACEMVLAHLPRTMAPATVRHVAQVVNRLLKMAVYPARLIEHSPLPLGFLPKVSRSIAFTYLYPDEDAKLLACGEVELVWRLLYGVLAREGMRCGEAKVLEWSDVDLARGVLTLDRNKTDDPRAWSMSGGVTEALRRWKRMAPSSRHVFAYPGGRPLDGAARADEFRMHLKKAGLCRPQLFEQSENRRPIRIHDLRATFVTTALAAGRSETWVADRTGHRSSEQINAYRRKARTHAELGLGELTPLVDAIPELARATMVLTRVA